MTRWWYQFGIFAASRALLDDKSEILVPICLGHRHFPLGPRPGRTSQHIPKGFLLCWKTLRLWKNSSLFEVRNEVLFVYSSFPFRIISNTFIWDSISSQKFSGACHHHSVNGLANGRYRCSWDLQISTAPPSAPSAPLLRSVSVAEALSRFKEKVGKNWRNAHVKRGWNDDLYALQNVGRTLAALASQANASLQSYLAFDPQAQVPNKDIGNHRRPTFLKHWMCWCILVQDHVDVKAKVSFSPFLPAPRCALWECGDDLEHFLNSLDFVGNMN